MNENDFNQLDQNNNNVTPEVPTQPVEPTVPVTPVEPVAPATPEAPVQPVEPVAPVTPEVPVQPVEPVAPVTPVAPTAPVEPVAPIAPETPAAPVQPVYNELEPEKKKGSGKIVGIVLILLILVGGGVAFYFLELKDLLNKNTNNTTTTTAASTTTTTTAATPNNGGNQTETPIEPVEVKDASEEIKAVFPNSIEEYKNNYAGKDTKDFLLLDSTFTEINPYTILNSCQTDRQEIKQTIDGHTFDVVCSVSEDGPDQISYSGRVDDKFNIVHGVTSCGKPQYFTNGKHLVMFDAGCSNDSGMIEIQTANRTSKIKYPSEKNGFVLNYANEEIEAGITPFIKNNILYFIDADDTSDRIVVVDLSEDNPKVILGNEFVR